MKWVWVLGLAACGSAPAVPDARPDAVDAVVPFDEAFDADGCPLGGYFPVLQIGDADSAFTPSQLSIPEMAYARFITSATHDMQFTTAPDSSGTPPAPVGFSTRACRQLGLPGTPFHLIVTCSAHGETAEITVEPFI